MSQWQKYMADWKISRDIYITYNLIGSSRVLCYAERVLFKIWSTFSHGSYWIRFWSISGTVRSHICGASLGFQPCKLKEPAETSLDSVLIKYCHIMPCSLCWFCSWLWSRHTGNDVTVNARQKEPMKSTKLNSGFHWMLDISSSVNAHWDCRVGCYHQAHMMPLRRHDRRQKTCRQAVLYRSGVNFKTLSELPVLVYQPCVQSIGQRIFRFPEWRTYDHS